MTRYVAANTDSRWWPVAACVAIIGIGGLMRLWALDSGIPYAIGVDEPFVMNAAVRMMKTGDFNPHFFDYGGLYIYLQLGVACVRFMVGAIGGLWSSLAEVNPDQFYLWARALTALLGTATVGLVYLIGRRWGTGHAVLAAGVMAVMPIHVRESHYVLTDVPTTFFITLTFLLSLRAHERATVKDFAWAGVAAGLATSVKYPAGLALMMPLLAAWMTREVRPSRLIACGAVGGTFAAAFLIGSPYTVLDLPAFLNGFANLVGSYLPRTPDMESGWIIYLKHLRLAMGWPGLVMTLAGLGVAAVSAVRGPGRLRWGLIVLFPMAFMASIAGRGLIFARYMLPVVPFVCVLAAIGIVSSVSLLRRFEMSRFVWGALVMLLASAVVVPPAVTAINFDRTMAKRSTAALAYEWIVEHVPRGSSLIVERTEVRLPANEYRVEHVTFLTEYEYEQLANTGVDFFMATSQSYGQVFEQPQLHADRYAAYRRIFDRSVELVRFSATDEHPGPELRIFRLP